MSMPGMEKMKFIMALYFMFLLIAAPSVWCTDANAGDPGPASSESAIMASALMRGHIAEAMDAAQQRKDLKGAATHAQMALKAGETVQAAYGTNKVDPGEVKKLNDGMQSLNEALQKAQSGDSEGFMKAADTAMNKITPPCHGPGCQTAGCGCALAQPAGPCDPANPAKKCRTAGCNCYCM